MKSFFFPRKMIKLRERKAYHVNSTLTRNRYLKIFFRFSQRITHLSSYILFRRKCIAQKWRASPIEISFLYYIFARENAWNCAVSISLEETVLNSRLASPTRCVKICNYSSLRESDSTAMVRAELRGTQSWKFQFRRGGFLRVPWNII